MSKKPSRPKYIRGRGGFRPDWWVFCGQCDDGELAYDSEDATTNQGFVYTRALGWRCPSCVKKGEK